MADFNSRAAAIRLVCFDVDGTLTDGRLIFDSQGHESKAFHVHDGQGLRLLEDSGIAVALITARHSRIVQTRGSDLRLKYVYDGVKDKLAVLQSICIQEGLTLNQVAYMGDDYPDLACLQSVGLATCPADAMPAIRNCVHWCSSRPGGSGAARELADLILTVQGQLETLQHRYGAQ